MNAPLYGSPTRTLLEKEFIHWITEQNTVKDPRIRVGIGDDAAVFAPTGDVVITTDSIAEGTHFRVNSDSLHDIGRKAMSVSLSDLAAMAAHPVSALVNIQAPNSMGIQDIKRLYNGLRERAGEFQVSIIGGDTNSWPGGLVVTTTLLGTPSRGPNGKPKYWRLDSAQVGDTIFVSGSGLGFSILGHHLNPTPRVRLAQYLNENYDISAATDASDSLAIDLAAIASASCVGFTIVHNKIPIRQVDAEANSERSRIEHALYDGEDFELLFTLSAEQADCLKSDNQCPDPVTAIGVVTANKEFLIADADGKTQTLPIKGYEH